MVARGNALKIMQICTYSLEIFCKKSSSWRSNELNISTLETVQNPYKRTVTWVVTLMVTVKIYGNPF